MRVYVIESVSLYPLQENRQFSNSEGLIGQNALICRGVDCLLLIGRLAMPLVK